MADAKKARAGPMIAGNESLKFGRNHSIVTHQRDNRIASVCSMIALGVVFAGLVGVRLVRGENAASFTGGETYRAIAENLAGHSRFSIDGVHPTGYRPPAYPLLLAGMILALGEHAPLGGWIANLAIDACCLAMLLMLVWRLAKCSRAMWIAGLVFAADVAFHLEAMAQRETMLYSLLLLIFFVTASSREIGLSRLLILATTAGLAWLTRPTGIALAPLLVIAAYFLTEHRTFGVRFARVCTACCIFAAVVIPWQAFLLRSFSEPVLAGTTSGGLNLYQGNNPAADVLIPYVDVDAYLPEIETRMQSLGLAAHDEIARNRQLKADAFDYIASDPMGFVRQAAVKTLALYSPVPTPLGSSRIDASAGSISLREFKYRVNAWTIVLTAHGLVLIGFLGAAIVRWKTLMTRRPRAVVLIVGYILIVTLLHAITFAETRFRLPLDPLIIALGVTALWARKPGEPTNDAQ